MNEVNKLYKEFLNKCYENNYSTDEIDKIIEAYEYAYLLHKGQKRKNGDEFIIHPLTTALLVANLNTDVTTVISALVHETVGRGTATLEELEDKFGSDVRNIVESLLKVNKLHLMDESESSALYLRKVLVALSEDVRVIIVKLASRIHNLRTIDGMSEEEAKIKARETWNVLIPIAHRLGINAIKSELEDLSFRILKPEIYDEIESELPEPRSDLVNMLNETTEDISELLRDNGINFEIKCRVKSVSSINNKLTNGHTWSKIYDILGIRVICEEISECYLIIGLIHSKYRPIPKRFKDYIAMPKGNSYQSLHTGIYGPDGIPVEVQVRTKEMNEIAEHGMASHWSYKEHGTKNALKVMEQKLQMFRNTIDASNDDITNDNEFASSVTDELLSKSIYVNTPNGDVIELPIDSTPVDFAYRIHSKVGDTCIGAIVNDNIVTLDYKLSDGDIVKIRTDANSTPNKDWLNFVKTTQAKSKIKSYFSKQDKEEYIERGKALLEKEIRKQKLSISETLSEDNVNKLISDLHVGSWEDVLLSIGSLRYTPVYIVNLIYQGKETIEDALFDKVSRNPITKVTNYKNDIIVSGFDDLLVNLASCCKPVYGDEIIGYITKGNGITIHKKDCKNVSDLTSRLIDATWNENNNTEGRVYVSKIRVYLSDNKFDLLSIVAKATTRNVILSNVNEMNHGNSISYDIVVKVKNKDSLDLFIEDLRTLSFIRDVRRY